MKTKRVRPVLVESTVRTNIWWSGHKLYYNRTPEEPRTPCYELVLISLEDEKTEAGDHAVSDNGYLIKVQSIDKDELSFIPLTNDIYCNSETWHPINVYKKVIARQSQISPEYISKFVEQFNNGCIEDFEIEIELQVTGHISWPKDLQGVDWEKGYPVTDYRPKLTNGFVTIVEKEPKQYSNNLLLQYAILYGILSN